MKGFKSISIGRLPTEQLNIFKYMSNASSITASEFDLQAKINNEAKNQY